MGRATLINSVALAIPSYSMSSFQIRSGLCDEMDALIRKFWWNPSKESSHVHSPLNWETLCQPKKNGRLGFKYFADFNLALLSKMAWWILEEEDSPCVQALKAKYKVVEIGCGLNNPESPLGFGKALSLQRELLVQVYAKE